MRNIKAALHSKKNAPYDQMQYNQMKFHQNGAVMKNTGSMGRLAVSLVVSLLFFGICLLLLNRLTAEEEKRGVIVTLKAVPENMKITEENYGMYFMVKEVPLSFLPEREITSVKELAGAFTTKELSKNEILTDKDITRKAEVTAQISNPIEVAVGVNNIAQMVGGTLREGDIVNISSIRQFAAGEIAAYQSSSEIIAKEAYVTDAFTNSGVRVLGEDKETATTVVNILLPAEAEEKFNAAISNGTIRISKVCN